MFGVALIHERLTEAKMIDFTFYVIHYYAQSLLDNYKICCSVILNSFQSSHTDRVTQITITKMI
ncbi:hypothetical protein RB25_10495 [Herbaspirillum rubrisubalbicans]|uniref:Uncharacterized protein n=1 Tax=Herbaspirillum rubrisubalbicans TaxID=80842 RepID=A0ABX9C572_9BURK|nr:hypothetical protein RB24_05990 [Herbaspirillum rubrisubalbicans]RAN48543.1 hypothetical protein RB25_10495 [Herbaspirillum rubrisubalbicans]